MSPEVLDALAALSPEALKRARFIACDPPERIPAEEVARRGIPPAGPAMASFDAMARATLSAESEDK